MRIMRTTIAVDDHLLAAARRLAKERDQTLGQVVEDALRHEIADAPSVERVEVPVFRGQGGPRPGIDMRSNRAIREALDESTPIHALR
jgi:hypothetical protein